jgi:hypothetical protein
MLYQAELRSLPNEAWKKYGNPPELQALFFGLKYRLPAWAQRASGRFRFCGAETDDGDDDADDESGDVAHKIGNGISALGSLRAGEDDDEGDGVGEGEERGEDADDDFQGFHVAGFNVSQGRKMQSKFDGWRMIGDGKGEGTSSNYDHSLYREFFCGGVFVQLYSASGGGVAGGRVSDAVRESAGQGVVFTGGEFFMGHGEYDYRGGVAGVAAAGAAD